MSLFDIDWNFSSENQHLKTSSKELKGQVSQAKIPSTAPNANAKVTISISFIGNIGHSRSILGFNDILKI